MCDSLLENLGLAEADPDVFEIIGLEERRQSGKPIIIASESLTHWHVRQTLGSAFSSIYAEGSYHFTRSASRQVCKWSCMSYCHT
jgi:glycine/serine hydroxymethyltransferase